MSIDPLAEKYAYNSTYAFQQNKLGLGRELEGLELAYRDPTAAFGNYVVAKVNSVISSIQTTSEKGVQAVSSAISSLGINQVDGYTFSGSKTGVSGSTGFFPEAKGAKSSGDIDGNVIVGLADAHAPILGANKIMDGANIFSNLVQTFGTGNKSNGKAQANTSTNNDASKEEKIGISIATVTFDASANSKSANLHSKDTTVSRKDSARVTNEAKNIQQNDIKNFNKKHGTNF